MPLSSTRPLSHLEPRRASSQERALTQRETIVTRLPLQPPAKTPRPVLVRPVPGATAARDPGACAVAATPSPRRARCESPSPFAAPSTPAPMRAPTPAPTPDAGLEAALDTEAVPNLRPSPRYGLVLALIGALALIVGAVVAVNVNRVELEPAPHEAPAADVAPTPRPAPVVISDLPVDGASGAAPTAEPAR